MPPIAARREILPGELHSEADQRPIAEAAAHEGRARCFHKLRVEVLEHLPEHPERIRLRQEAVFDAGV